LIPLALQPQTPVLVSTTIGLNRTLTYLYDRVGSFGVFLTIIRYILNEICADIL